MTDRPILFSAPMIRALLDGRKTQTRRAIKSARVFATPERPAWTLRGDDLARAMQNADRFRRMDGNGWRWEADAFEWQAPHTRTGWLAHIGYAPGDRLWVREAWSHTGTGVWTIAAARMVGRGGVIYRADNDTPGAHWFPSIHMPREFSRLTLIVTDVRVQRLQEISEEDAIAEGIYWSDLHEGWTSGAGVDESCDYHGSRPDVAYAKLWDRINGPGAWESNPFVAAYSFTVHKANIDALDLANAEPTNV